VAANYYREARKAGGGKPASSPTNGRRGRQPAAPRAALAPPSRSGGIPTNQDIRHDIDQIQTLMTDLLQKIERQQEAYERARGAFS
jgi:hypothetical protein